jgi:ATP synthase protein I
VRKSSETKSESPQADFSRRIGAQEARKLKAKRRGVQEIWFGLGMFGLIGWAVAVPTVLGVMLGVFIDHHYPGNHSWTLSLLIVGLFVGCLNAWRWMAKEEKSIREGEERKVDE